MFTFVACVYKIEEVGTFNRSLWFVFFCSGRIASASRKTPHSQRFETSGIYASPQTGILRISSVDWYDVIL